MLINKKHRVKKAGKSMLASIKHNFLIYALNFLFATLSWIRNESVFKWSYSLIAWLAEKLVKKDYYIERIRWIKDLFDSDHPSLTVTKKNIAGYQPISSKDNYQSLYHQPLSGGNQ